MARPQHSAVKSEPLPGPSDVPGWQEAVRDGSYRQCRLEDIVIALQDLRADLGRPTELALAKHLSECMFKLLRKRVGASHPNQGQDIIDEVHDVLWEAILQPQSKDGQALRQAFVSRLQHRLKDALVRAKRDAVNRAKFNAYVVSSSDGESLDGSARVSALDEAEQIGQNIDVEAALSQIADPRKRLAFRFHMDGIPYKSTKGASIAKALGISERTAREWVKEAQELLKRYNGDVS